MPFGSYFTVTTWLVGVFCLEMVVDWVKHCFLVKFNIIPSSCFDRYRERLVADVLMCRTQKSSHLGIPCKGVYSFTHIPTRRLGFMAMPLASLILCCVPRVSWRSPWVWLCVSLVWIVFCILKILLSVVLVAFATQRRDQLKHLKPPYSTVCSL